MSHDDMTPRPKSFTDSELLKEVEKTREPFATVSELCERLEVSSTAVLARLKLLEKQGKIKSKKVGASARVWWTD